jgi:branched-chain amino acid transport system substrate-binding protein
MPPKKIKVGVIASTTSGFETTKPFYEQILQQDINAYMAKLPDHRFNPRHEFEFIVKDAQGDAAKHLELVEEFHDDGVDLVIGGGWSSQAAESLNYVNNNGMLLFSASSTAPVLAIPNDNLFRMCVDDLKQGPAIAEMLHSKGKKSVIVFHRDDAWGNGLFDAIKPEFEAKGGKILERIVYPPDTVDFTNYLQTAENKANAASAAEKPVAIELISFSESVNIVLGAENYPTIYDLEWFGCDGTAFTEALLEDAPDQSVKLKIYSTICAPDHSSKYEEIAARYEALLGQYFSYYSACNADIAWVIAMAVLEVKPSGGPPLKATDVIKVIPDVASRCYGYSGWCLLNEAGDRHTSNYEIWGYGMVDGEPNYVYFGMYDSITGTITWV